MTFRRVPSQLRRIGKSFSKYGLKGSVRKFVWVTADLLFDLKYSVDTRAWAWLDDLTIDSRNRSRGTSYQATRVLPLRDTLRAIRSQIAPESVLVDFGCGKGRVLLVASEFGFREVRGVEFARELCNIARSNCALYKSATETTVAFRVIESDVAKYAISADETCFFMFNPFDEVVLDEVLSNIAASLLRHPRKVLVIYCNPQHRHVFETWNMFSRTQELGALGITFDVYTNQA